MWTAIGIVVAGPALGLYLGLAAGQRVLVVALERSDRPLAPPPDQPRRRRPGVRVDPSRCRPVHRRRRHRHRVDARRTRAACPVPASQRPSTRPGDAPRRPLDVDQRRAGPGRHAAPRPRRRRHPRRRRVRRLPGRPRTGVGNDRGHLRRHRARPFRQDVPADRPDDRPLARRRGGHRAATRRAGVDRRPRRAWPPLGVRPLRHRRQLRRRRPTPLVPADRLRRRHHRGGASQGAARRARPRPGPGRLLAGRRREGPHLLPAGRRHRPLHDERRRRLVRRRDLPGPDRRPRRRRAAQLGEDPRRALHPQRPLPGRRLGAGHPSPVPAQHGHPRPVLRAARRRGLRPGRVRRRRQRHDLHPR